MEPLLRVVDPNSAKNNAQKSVYGPYVGNGCVRANSDVASEVATLTIISKETTSACLGKGRVRRGMTLVSENVTLADSSI